MKSISRKNILRTILLTGIFLVFLVALISEYIRISLDTNSLQKTELPIGKINGFARDNQGCFYIGSVSYSRIQVYSPDGEYIRGLFMQGNAGGAFRFRIVNGNELEVFKSRAKELARFDINGVEIEKIKIINSDEYWNWGMSNKIVDSSGVQYELKSLFWLFPRIIMTKPNGIQRIIMKQPLIWTIVVSPFPLYLEGILLIVTLGVFGFYWNRIDLLRRAALSQNVEPG